MTPARDRNAPHMLAILFEGDSEGSDAQAVSNIIRIEGADANARRRLRRRVVNHHGWGVPWIVRIIFETYPGNGAEAITRDVTRSFKGLDQ